MPETPKKKTEIEDEEAEQNDSWAEDQKERGYYYDDAHGYEVYTPEDEAFDSGDENELGRENCDV